MDDKSPYGGLTGIVVKGTQNDGNRSVLLSVTAEFLVGDRSRAVPPLAVSTYQWNGVDTERYRSLVLATGERADLEITYAHTADTRQIQIDPVIYIETHGWARLGTRVLTLDREHEVAYAIPLDVVEDRLEQRSTMDLTRARLEAAYGMSLKRAPTLTTRPEISPRKRRWFDVEGGRPLDEHQVSSKLMRLEDAEAAYAAAAERDRIEYETVLLPNWKEALLACVKSLFGTAARVKTILRYWNAHPPFAENAVASFIDTLLHSKNALTITDSTVSFFADRALAIQRSWMTRDELILINKLVVDRDKLFKRVERGYGSQYILSGCKLDPLLSGAICGRFIVQQYALDMVKHGLEMEQPSLIFAIITGVSSCYVRNKKDPFLARLVTATEKETIYDDIRCIGMFVRVGGEQPQYKYELPVIPLHRRPAFAPVTPFRSVALN